MPRAQGPDGKKASKKRRLSELPSGPAARHADPAAAARGAPQPAAPRLHVHLPPAQRAAAAPPPRPQPQPWQAGGAPAAAAPAPPRAAPARPPAKKAGAARKQLARAVLARVLGGVRRRLASPQLAPFKVGAARAPARACVRAGVGVARRGAACLRGAPAAACDRGRCVGAHAQRGSVSARAAWL